MNTHNSVYEAPKKREPVDLVGKTVRIVGCYATHHELDNGVCLCRLKGQVRKVVKNVGFGLYKIEGVARSISDGEFQLLEVQPATQTIGEVAQNEK